MRIFTILLGLVSASVMSLEQTHVDVVFDASTNYRIDKELTISTQMEVESQESLPDTEFFNRLPMDMTVQEAIVQTVTTGQASEAGDYPITLEFVKSESKLRDKDKEISNKSYGSSIYEGLILEGVTSSQGNIEYVSHTGKELPDEIDVTSIFHKLTYLNPLVGRTVVVGQPLNTTIPLSYPIDDEETVEVSVQVIYTLEKVDNGIAHFTVAYKPLKGDNPNMEFNLKGEGTFTYDINNRVTPMLETSWSLELLVKTSVGTLSISTLSEQKITTNVNS